MRLALAFEKEGLPKGWSLLPFGNIKPSTERFDPTKEENRRYVGLEHIGKNTGKIIGSQESKMAVSSKTVFCRGDLLYGKLRPYLNKVAVADFDGVCSTDILVFQQNSFIVNTFLKLCLFKSDFVEFANSTVTGVQHPRTSHKKLSDYPIPLPPLSEQHRIVSKIESIFAQIDASKESLKKVQALIKQTIQVVLKQAFEGKLVQQDPNNELQSISYEEISHENTAKYSNRIKKINLPSRWTFCLFEDIVDFKNGINFTKNEKGIKGIPTIDVLNMYSESPYVSLDKVYKVNKKTNSDYVLKNGDLLFVRSSVKREGVGYTTLFKEVGKDITYCGFIIRARLLFKDILPMYLLYYFRYNKTRNEIIKSASQVTITNINQKTLGKIQIVLPPISEQRRIVTKIESIFGNIDTLNLFCFILRGNLFTNIGYFMILYMQHVISEQ